MKSIKKRLVRNFMLVIIISVGVLQILLMKLVKEYYYNTVESILSNEIKMSADLYSRYFSDTSLVDNIAGDIDFFWKQTKAQVQIIDMDGTILIDSLGVLHKETLESNDYKKALRGQQGKWIGKVDYDRENVMAISYPLANNDNIVGVLRFITSLRETNKEIMQVSYLFIVIGVIVVIAVGFISILLANSIIEPIKEVTATAEKLALGKFEFRSKKRFEDEIGKLSDTMNYMAEEIMIKEQLKNEFISSISHELRTPLTIIKGWAITLNSDEIEDKAIINDGLKIIEKESERLTLMVEDLLDFSKFNSGKVVLNRENISICELIENIKKYMSLRADRDGIYFEVECDKDLFEINLDKNRIKQVLINVLDNAFKFTERGGRVKIFAHKKEDKLCIIIKDTGCGISNEELPRIKEKFYKGKNSKSQNGIGLSVSDEIISLHGGTLDIFSELGIGTTVVISIPYNN
jgi:signal transduction histidine kinase